MLSNRGCSLLFRFLSRRPCSRVHDHPRLPSQTKKIEPAFSTLYPPRVLSATFHRTSRQRLRMAPRPNTNTRIRPRTKQTRIRRVSNISTTRGIEECRNARAREFRMNHTQSIHHLSTRLGTLLDYISLESTGLRRVILTRPRCVFLSFSTSILTLTLSKTEILTGAFEPGFGIANV